MKPCEIELECLKIEGIKYAKAFGKNNPITGQHVEVEIELDTLCAGLMEQGIPPIYLVGMLQSQIHYILAALQEEDEE